MQPASVDPPPWHGLSAPDLGTQRLFRAELRGPEDSSNVRLVLRLWRADRFSVSASDRLGRALWQIEVDGAGNRARLVEKEAGCTLDPSRTLELPGVVIPLPVALLPEVLLGRLPAGVDGRGIRIGAHDERWSYLVEDGALLSWRLQPSVGAALEWRRTERGAVLALKAEDLELEWREVANEPLTSLPPAWRPRDEPECESADLS
jgi:hypothetical protein